MSWPLIIVLALVALIAIVPVTRRAVVLWFVFSRRLLPVLGRKLHLVGRDYTTARALRLAFEDLGPAYIKFGQMIASSPTAFSKATTEEFARCLDNVRQISKARVWQTLERELGKPPAEIFATIDEVPLASASIAQVHSATLPDGTAVVLKVQRPGVRGRIEQDLALMGVVAAIGTAASKLLRRGNLRGIVDDFRRTIREELDFELEADHIEEFGALLEREGLTKLATVPRVYRELTTKRVLVMQRFYGCRIDDKAGVDQRVAEVIEVMRATSEVFWTCVFLGGFFHGDIHAGNIMILDDGRLGYLDFGIFGRFSDRHRAALADWVGALVSGSGEQMARALVAMGAVGDGLRSGGPSDQGVGRPCSAGRPSDRSSSDLDWDAFVRDCTDAFIPLRAMTVDKPEMLEAFFPKLLAMARRHDLNLPSQFALILKQLTYFGRYVMIHAPHYNENLDPKSQQTFVKIFLKFNAWRQGRGDTAIEIRPAA